MYVGGKLMKTLNFQCTLESTFYACLYQLTQPELAQLKNLQMKSL